MQRTAAVGEVAGVQVRLIHGFQESCTIAHRMGLSYCWDGQGALAPGVLQVLNRRLQKHVVYLMWFECGLCRHANPVQRPGFADILLRLRGLCRDLRLAGL